MKRILITGAAGFIGHHLVEYLLKNTDWDVVGMDRLDVSGNLNRLAHLTKYHTRFTFVYHDLRSQINELLQHKLGPIHYIAHLAASSHVDRSITTPLEFVYDNVVGTANLLEYARHLDSLEHFVYFSTDEVFGPAPINVSYAEWDRYNSTNPYSATKAGGEELCVAYNNTYKLPVTITHCMNVYGIRQHPEKFIPKCIRLLYEGKPVHIHANLSNGIVIGSRFYVHVDDVSRIVLQLFRSGPRSIVGPRGETCYKLNIAGLQEIDNLEVVKIIAQHMHVDFSYELIDFHHGRPGHDLRYALTPNIDYMPQIVFEEAINDIVTWSMKHMDWLGL